MLWTQRRTNADIRNELEVPEGWLLNTVYRRKLKFFCHIKRHDSLEKAVLEGKVLGKRSRGRERRRWEDCISERLGYTTDEAGNLAQIRVLYRATVSGPFPSSHALLRWKLSKKGVFCSDSVFIDILLSYAHAYVRRVANNILFS